MCVARWLLVKNTNSGEELFAIFGSNRLMKKKWWQHLSKISGACFIIGFVALNNNFYSVRNIIGIALIVLGIITTAVYMFIKQGQRPESSN